MLSVPVVPGLKFSRFVPEHISFPTISIILRWVTSIKPTSFNYSTGFTIGSGTENDGGQYSFWAFECSLTNSYVLYRKFYKIHNKEPSCTHYEFVTQVALAWLTPSEYWHSSALIQQGNQQSAAWCNHASTKLTALYLILIQGREKWNTLMGRTIHSLPDHWIHTKVHWDVDLIRPLLIYHLKMTNLKTVASYIIGLRRVSIGLNFWDVQLAT